MIAALAPAGVPDADIVVSNSEGSALAAVQVKARRDIGADGGWHMKRKHETIVRPLLFYCFVDFGKMLSDAPRCWVLPSARVAKTVAETHQAWLSKPGKHGQVRNDSDFRRLRPHYPDSDCDPLYSAGWLDPFREAWSLIASASDAGDPHNR